LLRAPQRWGKSPLDPPGFAPP